MTLGVKNQNTKTKYNKITVLTNASLLYDELFIIYKKKYGQIFESKDKNWRQKDDCKSQKNLNFRLDQPQQ